MAGPVCTECGACCVSMHDQPAFCDLTEADLERLDRRWIGKHVMFSRPFDWLRAAIDGNSIPPGAIRTQWRRQARGPMVGIEACVCVALRGSLLHRVRCTIYDRRPSACREAVVPGTRTCRQIRKLLRDSAAQLSRR